MLAKLYVSNYALIRELDMSFGNGLTVITGETGAGKSILLGALSLVLGSRADTSVLLDKGSKCIVEGHFRTGDYDLGEFFRTNELDYDDLTIMRREINSAGKSRAFINDTPVNLNILRELGEKLIDIHSQHQTLMLNQKSFQLDVIDSFNGGSGQRKEYLSIYRSYRSILKEYSSLRESAEKNKADLDYFTFQHKQIAEAKISKGEQAGLESEQEMLAHAEEISVALRNAVAMLYSEDVSVLKYLRDIRQLIGKIKGYLGSAEEIYKRIESSIIELDDIAAETGRLAAGIEADPERLEIVNKRLDLIFSLCQKHRVSNADELLLRQAELEKAVTSIATSDERMEELRVQMEETRDKLNALASDISLSRKKVIPHVENEVTSMLKQLGMPNARFRIDLRKVDDFTPSGTDTADFLFSANKQVEPENIIRVASGGELSRVMLSLKSYLSRNSGLPAIIFDEIDSGVSGEVADMVGKILAEMGKTMQVINITHLPQVAARGSAHWHVYKDDTDDATITRVRLLSASDRVNEIARLLSGSRVTPASLRNAEELLKAGTK